MVKLFGSFFSPDFGADQVCTNERLSKLSKYVKILKLVETLDELTSEIIESFDSKLIGRQTSETSIEEFWAHKSSKLLLNF